MQVNFLKGLEKGFDSLHQQGAFLTVKGKNKTNTMTISWGNVGFMWQRPIFTAMVRKSRYTYELIEETDNFTVSVPIGNELKKALAICGSKSGRDMDKFKEAGIVLLPSKTVDSPIIKGCNNYYECKIVYKQPMDSPLLLPEVQNSFYSDRDYHTLYYGEIVACY